MVSISGLKYARPNHFKPSKECLLLVQLSAPQEENNSQVRDGQPSPAMAVIQPGFLTYQVVNHSHLRLSGRKENLASA